jgi:hypothetical protein
VQVLPVRLMGRDRSPPLVPNVAVQRTNPLIGARCPHRSVRVAGDAFTQPGSGWCSPSPSLRPAGGVGSLTIRLLAQHLGVKPMAIRARLLTDTELSLRFGPWISPEAELPYPLYVAARRDATAPSHRQRGRQWHPTAAVTCRGQ